MRPNNPQFSFPQVARGFPSQSLEAQKRYFSYRAMLVAIVSQNSESCLFLWGIAQLSRDTLQNGVSQRCACVKLSTKGGIAPFWGRASIPLKVSRDMGPLSRKVGVATHAKQKLTSQTAITNGWQFDFSTSPAISLRQLHRSSRCKYFFTKTFQEVDVFDGVR